MKYITKLKLAAVHILSDEEDKSSENMLQLMQDIVKVDLDTVMNYMRLGEEEHYKLFKEVEELTEIMVQLGES